MPECWELYQKMEECAKYDTPGETNSPEPWDEEHRPKNDTDVIKNRGKRIDEEAFEGLKYATYNTRKSKEYRTQKHDPRKHHSDIKCLASKSWYDDMHELRSKDHQDQTDNNKATPKDRHETVGDTPCMLLVLFECLDEDWDKSR